MVKNHQYLLAFMSNKLMVLQYEESLKLNHFYKVGLTLISTVSINMMK